MKSGKKLTFIPKIFGIIVTSLMFLIFGTALIMLIIEKGIVGQVEIITSMVDWHDDPTGFFITYIIGYAIVWWKPLWGSVIIILGSLLVSVINIDNLSFTIFAIPAFLVGFFYLLNCLSLTKRNIRV
jgi:hypothetical protein